MKAAKILIKRATRRWLVAFFWPALLVSCAMSDKATAEVQIRGFGTAGFVKSTAPYFLSDFSTNAQKIQFERDTRLGLNLHSKISDHWELVAQILSRANYDNFELDLDWAFAAYRPNDILTVRAGRLINPIWLVSEHIDVGFTYPWIRPPTAVYSLNPIKALNGASVMFTKNLPNHSMIRAEVIGGAYSLNIADGTADNPVRYEVNVNNSVGVNISYDLESSTLIRAAYSTADTDINLITRATIAAPVFGHALTTLNVGRAHFLSIGGRFELGDWVTYTEFARRLIEGSSFTTANAAYGTIGYTTGRFMPHVTFAWLGGLKGDLNTHPSAPAVATLLKNQYSAIGGVNFKADASVLLKLEIQRVEYRYRETAGDFGAWIFGSALDFIF